MNLILSSIRAKTLFAVLLMLSAIGLSSGCGSGGDETKVSDEDDSGSSKKEPLNDEQKQTEGRRWFTSMLKAYRDAERYSDAGVLTLTIQEQTKTSERRMPFSVTLARPSQLVIAAYESRIACDGKKFRAQILDPVTDDFDHQILTVDAPPKITLKWLDQLDLALKQPLAGSPFQLKLLLDQKIVDQQSEQKLLEGLRVLDVLPDSEIDGHSCVGLVLAEDLGQVEMWIDRKQHLLRRLVYSSEELRQRLGLQNAAVEIRLVADFTNATFDPELAADLFVLKEPQDAKHVFYFERPSVSGPIDLLGKPVPDYQFAMPDGSKLSTSRLGKTTALLFWSIDDPYSLPLLKALMPVHENHKNKARFLAVNTDPPEMTTEYLQAELKAVGITLPVLRATSSPPGKVFGFKTIPTLIVVGPTGKVENVMPGTDSKAALELDYSFKSLISGKSIYREVLEVATKDQAEYKKRLAAAIKGIQAATAAPATVPDRLTITSLWKCEDLKNPGNMLVAGPADSQGGIVIVDGSRGIARIDSVGKVAYRGELSLPETEAISFLRSAKDGQGRTIYVGATTGGQQVHILDDQLKRIISFPEGETAIIADLITTDFDGDGASEIVVGYMRDLGVQSWTSAGKFLWSNRRAAPDVNRLLVLPATGNAGKTIAVASLKSPLGRLDAKGKTLLPWEVPPGIWISVHVAAVEQNDTPDVCAFRAVGARSDPSDSGLVAVGLTATGDGSASTQKWEYALPTGVYGTQVEYVISANLLGQNDNVWVMVGPDGSIHFLSKQGKLIDRFNYGRLITGLTVTTIDGQPALVIASPGLVEAIRLKMK